MTILVAEIGWNFIGNLKLAKKMVLAIRRGGIFGHFYYMQKFVLTRTQKMGSFL